MKKLIALSLFISLLLASVVSAVEVSMLDYVITDHQARTAPYDVTILVDLEESDIEAPQKRMKFANVSFSVGRPQDNIPILKKDIFDNTIWSNHGQYFSFDQTPSEHNVFSVVATADQVNGIVPNGNLATYSIDLSDLPLGTYELNPNFLHSVEYLDGTEYTYGTSLGTSDVFGNYGTIPLTFDKGSITIIEDGVAPFAEGKHKFMDAREILLRVSGAGVPEPSALTLVIISLSMGVVIKCFARH